MWFLITFCEEVCRQFNRFDPLRRWQYSFFLLVKRTCCVEVGVATSTRIVATVLIGRDWLVDEDVSLLVGPCEERGWSALALVVYTASVWSLVERGYETLTARRGNKVSGSASRRNAMIPTGACLRIVS